MHLAHTLIQRLFQKTSKYWNIEIKPPTMKYWKIDYLASTNVAMIATSYNIEMTVTWPDLSRALPYSLFLGKDKRWNNIQARVDHENLHQEGKITPSIKEDHLHLHVSVRPIYLMLRPHLCERIIFQSENFLPLPPDLPESEKRSSPYRLICQSATRHGWGCKVGTCHGASVKCRCAVEV